MSLAENGACKWRWWQEDGGVVRGLTKRVLLRVGVLFPRCSVAPLGFLLAQPSLIRLICPLALSAYQGQRLHVISTERWVIMGWDF